MKIKLVAVGKLKKGYIREGVRDYVSRIKHYVPFETVETKEERIMQFLKENRPNVLLDRKGKMMSSEEFSEFVENFMLNGKDLSFFIGGAEGFSDEERQSADFMISFSEMTFPHELARLMLAEQIYRALTIIRGEKYHK